MAELAVKGPIAALPGPVQAKLLAPRNRETLRRLGRLAEAGDESD